MPLPVAVDPLALPGRASCWGYISGLASVVEVSQDLLQLIRVDSVACDAASASYILHIGSSIRLPLLGGCHGAPGAGRGSNAGAQRSGRAGDGYVRALRAEQLVGDPHRRR